MIQVAAQLLFTPTPLEHLVDGLGLRMDATREPYRRAEPASDLSHPMHH